MALMDDIQNSLCSTSNHIACSGNVSSICQYITTSACNHRSDIRNTVSYWAHFTSRLKSINRSGISYWGGASGNQRANSVICKIQSNGMRNAIGYCGNWFSAGVSKCGDGAYLAHINWACNGQTNNVWCMRTYICKLRIWNSHFCKGVRSGIG